MWIGMRPWPALEKNKISMYRCRYVDMYIYIYVCVNVYMHVISLMLCIHIMYECNIWCYLVASSQILQGVRSWRNRSPWKWQVIFLQQQDKRLIIAEVKPRQRSFVQKLVWKLWRKDNDALCNFYNKNGMFQQHRCWNELDWFGYFGVIDVKIPWKSHLFSMAGRLSTPTEEFSGRPWPGPWRSYLWEAWIGDW